MSEKLPDETPASEGALARAFLNPGIQAAVTLKNYERELGDLDLLSLVQELSEQVDATASGELGRAEAMLVSQAHTLDRLFHCLLQDASLATNGRLLELLLKLGLRAQCQCRATLETLLAMKSPRLVSQTNIAAVQQVNNGPNFGSPSGEDSEKRAKQTIGGKNEQRLDSRTPDSAGPGNPPMEAVEQFNRAEVC